MNYEIGNATKSLYIPLLTDTASKNAKVLNYCGNKTYSIYKNGQPVNPYFVWIQDMKINV